MEIELRFLINEQELVEQFWHYALDIGYAECYLSPVN